MANVPNKLTGDTLSANEYNQNNNEIKNYISNSGQTPSAADLSQLSKAVVNYVGNADYYNDSGSANAYVLDSISMNLSPTVFRDGLRVRFSPANTNTGASTVTVGGLGVKQIKKYGRTVDVEEGDLTAGRIVELTYSTPDDVFELITLDNPIITESIPLFRTISGLEVSNDSGTPATHIRMEPGTFKDKNSLNAFTLPTIMIKDLSTAWVEGSNVGGRASAVTYSPSKWYHFFAIAKADGTVDAGFDDNINASNLLADATGYTFFRRIWSVYNKSTNEIQRFTQFGEKCFWADKDDTPILITSTTPVATEIRTPPDVNTIAGIKCNATASSGSDPLEIFIGGKDLIPPQIMTASVSLLAGSTVIPDENFVHIPTDLNSEVLAGINTAISGSAIAQLVIHYYEEIKR